MKESQKKTRAIILSIVFLGVFVVLGTALMLESDDWRYLYHLPNSSQGLLLYGFLTFLGMFMYGTIGIGLGLTVTYGFRNKAAHWVYLSFYALAALIICGFGITGYIPGKVLWAVMIPNGLMALITTMTTYAKEKKALVLRLVILMGLLVAALSAGLL